MMFGRELRDNIPSISRHSTNLVLEEVIEKHDAKKRNAIESENQKRKARPDNIEIGDTVVAKNYGNKPGFVPRFGPKKYKVTEKEGPRCTLVATDSPGTLVRDTSHLKRIPSCLPGPDFLEEGGDRK